MPIIDFETNDSAIEGLTVITTKQVEDERGIVRELYRTSTYAGLADARLARLARCSQVNLTFTRRGAIRGLHGEQTTKLVGVATGEAFGAYVDARASSPTYGTVVTLRLTIGFQVLVPSGVCNGFQSTGADGCQYLYCFDEEWRPDMPGIGINALDAGLAVPWPIGIDPSDRSLLSAKDAALPAFEVLDGEPA